MWRAPRVGTAAIHAREKIIFQAGDKVIGGWPASGKAGKRPAPLTPWHCFEAELPSGNHQDSRGFPCRGEVYSQSERHQAVASALLFSRPSQTSIASMAFETTGYPKPNWSDRIFLTPHRRYFKFPLTFDHHRRAPEGGTGLKSGNYSALPILSSGERSWHDNLRALQLR